MQNEEGREGVKVCVTGAGGYIGSWLVKNLLQRGYTVNGTLRDPQNGTKTGPLLSLPRAAERLKLFQADLCEEGSFDSAVEGCEGVFHVATPKDYAKLSQDDYIENCVKGTLNVLKACSRAKSVKRVVYTSSMAANSPLNEEGKLTSGCFVDESVWTPVDFMRTQHKHPSGPYSAAKTLAEQAALEYGSNSEIEIVTIGPGFVAGPGLTSTFPSSCNSTLGLITGHSREAMKLTQSFSGSLPFVHIDDACEAHLFLMEQPNVHGRYICFACSLTFPQLVDFVRKRYPHFNPKFKSNDEDADSVAVPTSGKKLLDMGFTYKYGLEDIFDETIKYAQSLAILEKITGHE